MTRSESERIIEVSNLSKSYGQIRAVRDISFYVERGKFFAFLGPNGAGKSTTIDMICTFMPPDSGEVSIDGLRLGRDDAAIRSKIGVVFQDGLLDLLLTVEENLSVRASFYQMTRQERTAAITRVAKTAGIQDLLKRPYGRLSGGQRRRCDIARALLHTPDILFLDEPTTGLDPQTRKIVWETILRLQQEQQMTIFMTTHYMEEAATADYVIVIDNGGIAARGTPLALRDRYTSDRLMIRCHEPHQVCRKLEADGYDALMERDRVVVRLPDTLAALPLLNALSEQLISFEVQSGTMDDAFIAITGKELRE